MQLPDEMNQDLLNILGRPNFQCVMLARSMRLDGVEIPQRSEAEQAHVLFKLLGFYSAHGSDWRAHAAIWIDEMINRALDSTSSVYAPNKL